MRRVAFVVAGFLLALNVPFAAAPAAAATQQVMMQDYAYSPASITVRVGDTVTWMQHDQAPHDVTTTSAPVAFRSPQLSQGQSWSYTFRQAGTYSYYCSVHPDMRASVTVLPAPTTEAPKPVTTAPAATKPKTTAQAPTSAAGAPATAATPSMTATSSAAAAAPAPEQQQQPPVQQAAASSPSLDPMLLVAGLVTGIAVLCLLLLSSRRA